jgi:hypothetical protein
MGQLMGMPMQMAQQAAQIINAIGGNGGIHSAGDHAGRAERDAAGRPTTGGRGRDRSEIDQPGDESPDEARHAESAEEKPEHQADSLEGAAGPSNAERASRLPQPTPSPEVPQYAARLALTRPATSDRKVRDMSICDAKVCRMSAPPPNSGACNRRLAVSRVALSGGRRSRGVPPLGPPPSRGGRGASGSLADCLPAVIAVTVVITVLVVGATGWWRVADTTTAVGQNSPARMTKGQLALSPRTRRVTRAASRRILEKSKAVNWSSRDQSLPASAWTAGERARCTTPSEAMADAVDQTVNLVKLTPHRVMRELYEQFIAYPMRWSTASRPTLLMIAI